MLENPVGHFFYFKESTRFSFQDRTTSSTLFEKKEVFLVIKLLDKDCFGAYKVLCTNGKITKVLLDRFCVECVC